MDLKKIIQNVYDYDDGFTHIIIIGRKYYISYSTADGAIVYEIACQYSSDCKDDCHSCDEGEENRSLLKDDEFIFLLLKSLKERQETITKRNRQIKSLRGLLV